MKQPWEKACRSQTRVYEADTCFIVILLVPGVEFKEDAKKQKYYPFSWYSLISILLLVRVSQNPRRMKSLWRISCEEKVPILVGPDWVQGPLQNLCSVHN